MRREQAETLEGLPTFFGGLLRHLHHGHGHGGGRGKQSAVGWNHLVRSCCQVSIKQRKSSLWSVRRSWMNWPLFVSERMLISLKLTEVLSSLVRVKASLDGLANTV